MLEPTFAALWPKSPRSPAAAGSLAVFDVDAKSSCRESLRRRSSGPVETGDWTTLSAAEMRQYLQSRTCIFSAQLSD